MMKLNRKLLWLSLIMLFLVSMTMVSPTSAPPPPDPYVYIDPATVSGVSIGGTVAIYVKVNDVPPEINSTHPGVFAWEVTLTWDPNLLELYFIQEQDFLSRGMYSTTFSTYPVVPPYDQANAEGKIKVACSLDNPNDPWASQRDGDLFRLAFEVLDDGSTLIDLQDTIMIDHLLGPVPMPTTYRNEDCFFYNVDPSHDIRTTDVKAFPPEVSEGENVTVTVTVLNEGTETETDFNLTIYANETQVHSTLLSLAGSGHSEDRSTIYETEWNTTGFGGGMYIVSANVTDVSGEVDTADNNFTDGEVEVVIPVHDLAVISINFSPKVYVGKNATIYVQIENQGHFNETFDVTAYRDSTLIGTKTVTSLEGQSSTMVEFVWVTTGVAEGTYTISANASVVAGETETGDNLLIDGTLHVKIVGDVNGDGTVDASDLYLLSRSYDKDFQNPYFKADADFNSDLMVDALDLSSLDENFGRSE